MKTRGWQFIVAGLILVNLGLLTTIWMRRLGPPPPPPGGPGKLLARELDWTVEQQATFEDMHQLHRQRMDSLRREEGPLREAFFAGISQAWPDSTVLRKANEIGAWEARRELEVYRHFKAVQEICTPEQQEQFEQFLLEVLRRRKPPIPGGRPGPG